MSTNPSAPICRYFVQGSCKFGTSCRFRHDRAQVQTHEYNGGFGRPQHRQQQQQYTSQKQQFQEQQKGSALPNFVITGQSIKADIEDQVTMYPFSCYGPDKSLYPPVNLIADSDISMEELRFAFYSNAQECLNVINARMQLINAIKKQVFDNADALAKDLAKRISAGSTDVFGLPSQTQTSAFGQPQQSAFAQPQQSAFGQPQTSAFGQPQQQSAFAQPQTSAFGQPQQQSAFAQPQTSTFAQPQTSLFGQPQQQSTFGAPQQQNQQSAFGQQQQHNFAQPGQGGVWSANTQFQFGNIPTQPPPHHDR